MKNKFFRTIICLLTVISIYPFVPAMAEAVSGAETLSDSVITESYQELNEVDKITKLLTGGNNSSIEEIKDSFNLNVITGVLSDSVIKEYYSELPENDTDEIMESLAAENYRLKSMVSKRSCFPEEASAHVSGEMEIFAIVKSPLAVTVMPPLE